MQLENKRQEGSSQKSQQLKQRSRSVFKDRPDDKSSHEILSKPEQSLNLSNQQSQDTIKPRKKFVFNPKQAIRSIESSKGLTNFGFNLKNSESQKR